MNKYIDSPEPEPLSDKEIDDLRFSFMDSEDLPLLESSFQEGSFPEEF